LRYFHTTAYSTLLLGASLAGCAKGGPSVGLVCPPGHLAADGICDIRISVDSIGFLPARIKEATLAGVGPSFVVRRADGSEVLRAMARGPIASQTDSAGVYIADFSRVTATGDYFIEAGDESAPVKSPTFHIGADAYDDALHTLMLGMYGWRCGTEIHFDFAGHTFSHAACHANDAYQNYVNNDTSIKPSLYGWHDAGDYGKYVTNGAFSLGMFLEAWELFPDSLGPMALEIPEHGGALPDFLAELKWELDWLLTTQFSDGGVSHKVTALNFEGLSASPEGDGSPRYFAPTGTAATAELVAVAAMASKIYAPYDAAFATKCLAAAQLSYQYLQRHTADQRPNLTGFNTGGYQMGDADPRLWAAVELWDATGDPAVLADAQTRVRNRGVDGPWDWGNPANLGLFSYLISKRDGRDSAIVSRVTTAVRTTADNLAGASEQHPYGRSFPNYFWGSNGSIVRNVMNFQIAYRLFGDLRYLDASVRQIDHLFGRNVYARSQVTGLGANPPLYPHHRPSIAYGFTFPGLVVGGAQPTARSWVDSSTDFNTNEVAINWNAALVFALAGFTSRTDGGIVGLDAGTATDASGAGETGESMPDASADGPDEGGAPEAAAPDAHAPDGATPDEPVTDAETPDTSSFDVLDEGAVDDTATD
jgi:endoglucanase